MDGRNLILVIIDFLILMITNFPLTTVSVIQLDHHGCDKDQNNSCLSFNGVWNVTLNNNGAKFVGIVPGGIYSDLMRTKMINDIYIGFNDLNYRWLSENDWTFTYTFKLSEHIIQRHVIFLTFYGIDTVAKIYLNGKHVGDTFNMFIRYSFSIKRYLKYGKNLLKVQLYSPIEEAKKYFSIEGKHGNHIKPECPKPEIKGECYMSCLRKQQISFGSDLGPAFPNLGIWQKVHLEYFTLVLIRDIQVNYLVLDDKWKLEISVQLEGSGDSDLYPEYAVLTTTLHHHENHSNVIQVNEELNPDDLKQTSNAVVQELNVPKEFVDLWWPNGYGNQTLYTLTCVFSMSHDKSVKSIKIGFRTVELIEDNFEEHHKGYSFFFKINNVTMFMKGANWIPIHILPEIAESHSGRKTIYKLLLAAKWANMNMIRIWGGGVYQTDFFYSTADELGILIWQDFMFSGAIYPISVNFIREVRMEIEQQVQRLQHHPSIVLWVGNDEIELGIHNKWLTTQRDCLTDLKNYKYLFHNTMKKTVEMIDKTRTFLYSSPSNGQDMDAIRPGRMHNLCSYDMAPDDELNGDSHYFPNITNIWDPFAYDVARFVSEYGMQSFPSYQTMLEYANDTEWRVYDKLTVHRQHFEFGQKNMEMHMQNLFEEVPVNDTKRFIYLSQILQAVALKTQTEVYRRIQNRIYPNSLGLTMGALYWHLNDVWPTPSWSSIDFKGNWKMAHYYARNFFAPLLVSGYIRFNTTLEIFVISDYLEIIHNVTLRIQFYNFESFKTVRSIRKHINIMPLSALMYLKVYLHRLEDGERYNHTMANLILLSLRLPKPGLFAGPPHNFILLKPIIAKELKQPNLTVKVVHEDFNNNFILQITAEKFAPWVWLQTSVEGYFSDNGFMMTLPSRNVTFHPYDPVKWEVLDSSLHISSLNDTSNMI